MPNSKRIYIEFIEIQVDLFHSTTKSSENNKFLIEGLIRLYDILVQHG